MVGKKLSELTTYELMARRLNAMTLTLRTMNKHAQLMGWGDHWREDDVVVLDEDGRSVRACRTTLDPSNACQEN
jgi:hypothetical protein